jgi:hypothetical protein
MEPRPPSPRSSQGQQPAGSGRASEETGAYQQQPDAAPGSAPQRSDYDYSPLDLAPPGQRRRRQLVAAIIGGAVVLLLTAASVFAIIALRGDGDDDATDLAALQTQIATLEVASVGTPDVADADASGDEVAEAEPTVQGDDPAGTGEDDDVERVVAQPGEPEAAEPTSAPEETEGGPSQGELEAMLPAEGTVPQGLDAVENTSRTEEEVVNALGGNREAEMNLDQWGWSGNVERRFTASDPAALSPEATTDITVSLHGFASDQAATDALTFYSDILALSGYEEVEAGDIGTTNRLLRLPQEDGGTTVALYVQEGPVLYRIGGYSPGGDPTTNIVNVAQAMISE